MVFTVRIRTTYASLYHIFVDLSITLIKERPNRIKSNQIQVEFLYSIFIFKRDKGWASGVVKFGDEWGKRKISGQRY